MNEDYTPTTDAVREKYSEDSFGWPVEDWAERFDRWFAPYAEAFSVVQMVRGLHRKFRDTHGNDCCEECSKPQSDGMRHMRAYPCDTIKALEGESND